MSFLNKIADKAQQVTDQARQRLEEAKREAASEGGPTSLLGKTVQAALNADDKMNKARGKVGQAAGRKLNEITGNDQASQKVAAGLKTVENAALKARAGVRKATDHAAEATASKITEFTGRATTAREVKTAVVLTGLLVGAASAFEGAMDGGMAGVDGMDGGFDGGGDVAPDSATGFDGPAQSVEEEQYKFFADKGGLNIQTDVVDMDGCVLDSGA